MKSNDAAQAESLEALVEQRTAELQKALEELERLSAVTRSMTCTLDLDEVLDRLIGELEALFSFEGIAILLLAEGRTRLRTRKLRIPGMPPARLAEILKQNEAIPVDLERGGRVARAVLTGQDFYFDEVDPEALPSGPNRDAVVNTGLRSALILPLLVDEEAIGVMIMSGYTRSLHFSDDDIKSVKRFVGQITQALKNSQIHDALQETTRQLEAANRQLEEQKQLLERLSRTDELTGILNRRAFFERAATELERSRRYGSSLYVFMLDLDDFKRVNDTHGHDCGDAALRSFARVVESVLRRGDLFARYGGEEFVLASVDNDADGAWALGERMRQSVATTPFRYQALQWQMTVSIGYSCFPAPTGPQRSIDEVIKEADEALYAAKEAGKNRCVFRHESK